MSPAFSALDAQELQRVLHASPLGIALCRDRMLAAANASLLRMLGADGELQAVGRPLSLFVTPESSAALEELMDCAHDLDPAKRTCECKLLRLDGAAFDAEVTVYEDREYQPTATVVYVSDLSRRTSSALQLRSAKEELERLVTERTAVAEERLIQLRAMAAKLTHVGHTERRRLAQVLHDRVQQNLVAAKFALAVMPGRDESTAAHAAWQGILKLLDDSIQCTRSLAIELSPPILYTSGLPEALKWLAHQKERAYGLAVEVKLDPTAKPASDEVATVLYDVVSELLFNVFKHAQAKLVRIALTCNGNDAIEIDISDDGVGFDPLAHMDKRSGTTGLGLFGIRERMMHLGCGFRLESAPGKGTRIVLRASKRLKADAGDSDLAFGVLDMESPLQADEGVPPKGGTIRVLLVEDHEIVRKGIRQILQGDPSIEVVGEAADGRAAVESALTLRPDVIVMDVVLPKINGIQATRRIVAQMPNVRIIGLSVFAQEEMARQMINSGAQCYLTKGGPVEGLLAAVKGTAEVPPQ